MAAAVDNREPGLSLIGVSFSYGKSAILSEADFEVAEGETVVVTGRNGSGKSTFLYLCAGLLPPREGTVMLGGHRADSTHPSDLFRAGIRRGFVFQEGGLLSNMNALANVVLPLSYHADVLGLDSKGVEQRARDALDRVQLPVSDRYSLPAHLSFGNRKRLALARAIAMEPNFFFFDDPDIGLDPKTAALVHEILCRYRDDSRVTMIVATNRDLLIERLEVQGYTLRNGNLQTRTPSTMAPAAL